MYGYEEHLDFHYSTDAEWDRAEAREVGFANPDRAWICTDRDVWHANPFYTGPAVRHPEDYSDEDEAQHGATPLLVREFDEVVPF